MSIQLREVLKVCQGCHNLNCTAKQPVVMGPTVQFCPVPLTKRMPERVGQVSISFLYFAEIITVLVVKINHYYYNYVDRLDDRRFPEPDVTEAEMFVFLALTMQMRHGVRDKLADYWATMDQLYTLFYGTMMKRGRIPAHPYLFY